MRTCEDCGGKIPKERIEALPETSQCVKCAAKNPKIRIPDAEEICAKPSITTRNGFGGSD
jgi:RNA polymerase-binding transcription factor DksA